MNPPRFAWLCLGLSALAGLAMISTESLWIDEGQTLRFARLPTLAAFGHELVHNTKSEAQMPVGMAAAWLGGKLLGFSEWSLRAVNVLWVALGGLAAGLAGRQLKLRWLLPLFLVNPFLWFYANEARPYALQICAGTWLLLVLARAHARGTLTAGDMGLLALWGFLGFGASLLFGIAFIAVLTAAALMWRRNPLRLTPGPALVPVLILGVLALGALGAWQFHKLRQGAAGARLWQVSPVNLAFAYYETLGFSGLGPPRHELRELARTPAQLASHLLQPRLALGLGALAVLYVAAATRLWRARREPLVQWLLAALIAGSIALYLAAVMAKFPFWGRHLAPLLPFLVALMARAVQGGDGTVGSWRRDWLALALMVPLLISSLLLRFSPQHRKDDYRGAAHVALAELAAGRTVWWSADPEECAAYYGLSPVVAVAMPGRLVFAYRPTPGMLAEWPEPDLVILSKPDIHDPFGVLGRYLDESPLRPARRLSAFSILARPRAVAAPERN